MFLTGMLKLLISSVLTFSISVTMLGGTKMCALIFIFIYISKWKAEMQLKWPESRRKGNAALNLL